MVSSDRQRGTSLRRRRGEQRALPGRGTGFGEKPFLFPAEAVTDVGEDRVTIEQGKEKVMGSPPFDTDLVRPATDYQRDVYSYYGYPPYPWGV